MFKDDEFNAVKINNEKDGFSSFEFGSTPNSESFSTGDNRSSPRDELNDATPSNSENKSKENKRRKDENEDQLKEMTSESSDSSSSSDGGSGGSNASSGASSAASSSAASSAAASASSVAAVAGASLVAVVSISTLVGINVFVAAKCNFKYIEPAHYEIAYALNLSETNNDEFLISLNNPILQYNESQELAEGDNEGLFTALEPDTEYTLTVIDVTASNYEIYKETVRTLPEDPKDPAVTVDLAIFSESAKFEENVFTLQLSYPEERETELSDIRLHMLDVEKNEKIIPLEISLEEQIISLEPKSDEDIGFFVGDEDGFDYHLTYYSGEELITTESNHVIFTEDVPPVTTYVVTLLPGEGSGDPVETVVEDGEAYTLPEPTMFEAPSGYQFYKWVDENGDEYSAGGGLFIEEDKTFTATWVATTVYYTISFDANGGEGQMSDMKVKQGLEFEFPFSMFTAPAGQEFAYWTFTDVSGEEIIYEAGQKITPEGDMHVVANWKYITVTVSFASNNGKSEYMEPIEMEYGSTYTAPECEFSEPDDEHVFEGWLIGDDTSPKYPGTYAWNVYEDTVLTASWRSIIAVRYYQSSDNPSINFVDKVDDPGMYQTLGAAPFEAPSVDMTFVAWVTDEGEQIEPGAYIELQSSTNLTAVWEQKAFYQVKFLANEGSGSMEEYETEIMEGEKFTVPQCYFTAPEGQRFAFWEDDDGIKYEPDNEVIMTSDLFLTAIWTDLPQYTVHFDSGEGEGTMEDYSVFEGDTFVFPRNHFVAPDGLMFKAYIISGDVQAYHPGDTITVNSELTVTAIYKEYEQYTSYGDIIIDYVDIEEKVIGYSCDSFDDPYCQLDDFSLELSNPSTDTISIAFDCIKEGTFNEIPLTDDQVDAINVSIAGLFGFSFRCTDVYTTNSINMREGAICPLNINRNPFSTGTNTNPNMWGYNDGIRMGLGDDSDYDMIQLPDGDYYFPIFSNLVDPMHKYGGNILVRVSSDSFASDGYFKTSGGLQLIHLGSNISVGTKINIEFVDPKDNETVLRSFSNIRLIESAPATYEYAIYNFAIDYETFSNSHDCVLPIMICAKESTLSAFDNEITVKINFAVQQSVGPFEVEFDITNQVINQQLDGSYISVSLAESQSTVEELIQMLKYYPVTINLIISMFNGNETYSYCGYSMYSFK